MGHGRASHWNSQPHSYKVRRLRRAGICCHVQYGQAKDAASLYSKLEENIIPMFYHERDLFIDVMRHSIALNGSFFNTHRVVQQYVLNAYFL
jgi:hypothetical protein